MNNLVPLALVGAAPAAAVATLKHVTFPQLPRHLRPTASVSLPGARLSVKAMAPATPEYPALGREKKALISVSNKKGLPSLATALVELGYTIVSTSTGGTAWVLENAGVPVTKVEDHTSFPEMLDDPSARRDQAHHMEALTVHGISTFDIVVINLHPFRENVTSSEDDDVLENMDTGGQTMIRAAAKSPKDVLVVVDPEDYPAVVEYLQGNQEDQSFRIKLAAKASHYSAAYDRAASGLLWKPPSIGREKSALISVYNKEGLYTIATALVELGYTIFSQGGTAWLLENVGLSVTVLEYVTSIRKMLLDGGVETLHKDIPGGIPDQADHVEAPTFYAAGSFDVVVVNLCPFYEQVTSSEDEDYDVLENMDIDGQTMILTAAKSPKDVLVVVDPEDYPVLVEFLKGNQEDQSFRRKLACKALHYSLEYGKAASELVLKAISKG